jgi:23S rRNA pseudouridine2605 synthase
MRRAGRAARTARVPLNRALSKLGILSRARATEAIRAGRVSVNGRAVHDPLALVVPEQVRIAVDGEPQTRSAWRTILLYKPTGVVTTRRDPEGRRTVFDVIGDEADGLVAVGRLDLATSGLLILTSDTRLADRLTDPRTALPRLYVVTVRGAVTVDDGTAMEQGVISRGECLRASSVVVRKASTRESHLTIELTEGRNREIRRLCEAIGHEVTRLKRVRFGRLEIGDLEPGQWRYLTRREVNAAFG